VLDLNELNPILKIWQEKVKGKKIWREGYFQERLKPSPASRKQFVEAGDDVTRPYKQHLYLREAGTVSRPPTRP
jgi:hypothetical protein